MSAPELPPSDTASQARLRWVVGVVGVAGIAFGVYLTFGAAPTWPERISTGLWLLVPPVVDDLVLLPLAAVVGWFVVARVRRPWRDVILVALTLSLVAVILAVPFLTGYGRLPDNPSLLDRNYVAGTVVVLGVIWIGCLLAGVLLRRRVGSKRTEGQPRR